MALKITEELNFKGVATSEAYIYIEEFQFDKTEKMLVLVEGEEPVPRIVANVGTRPYFDESEREKSPEDFKAFDGIKTNYVLYLTLESIIELGIFAACYAELRQVIKKETGIPLSRITNQKS